MACCVNKELKEQRRINKEIEKLLKKDQKDFVNALKLSPFGIIDFTK